RREVSALTDARKTLAYDFFRILRAPQRESRHCPFLSAVCLSRHVRLEAGHRWKNGVTAASAKDLLLFIQSFLGHNLAQ
ncbi:hypothetical protein ACK36E_19660, partial [Aeromonas veronii]